MDWVWDQDWGLWLIIWIRHWWLVLTDWGFGIQFVLGIGDWKFLFRIRHWQLQIWDWRLTVRIRDLEWGLGLWTEIGELDWIMGIRIWDWDRDIGDLKSGLKIKIGDWDWRLWIRIENKDMELGIGRNAPETGFSVFLIMNDSWSTICMLYCIQTKPLQKSKNLMH